MEEKMTKQEILKMRLINFKNIYSINKGVGAACGKLYIKKFGLNRENWPTDLLQDLNIQEITDFPNTLIISPRYVRVIDALRVHVFEEKFGYVGPAKKQILRDELTKKGLDLDSVTYEDLWGEYENKKTAPKTLDTLTK